MRIYVTSVMVDDQARALDFYTNKLGFQLKHDIPIGAHRWLTVVSKEQPDGTELLLEPSEHPAAQPFKRALVQDGIPATSFQVDDVDSEFKRLKALGVRFTMEPMDAGTVRMVVFDDTCGNLIQLVQMTGKQQ
jgi:catechol 2,3-dioxygenase-like lactoylglutathione lyase family enzyme